MLYHGLLAPHARCRARAVAYGTVPAATSLPASPNERMPPQSRCTPLVVGKLMHRAFEIDGVACLRCGGRLRLIATVEDPRAIREVLGALARSTEPVDRAPPPSPSVDATSQANVCA